MPLTRSQQNPSPTPQPSSSSATPMPDDARLNVLPENKHLMTLDTLTTEDNANPSLRPPNARRIPDSAVPYFRSARRALQGQVRSNHHATYLNLCLEQNTTPKGLQTRVPPAIPEPDFNFSIEWEKAHNDFARALTILLSQYYTERKTRLQNQLETCKNQILTLCSPETNQHINLLLEQTERELLVELSKRRENKITRDVDASNNTN